MDFRVVVIAAVSVAALLAQNADAPRFAIAGLSVSPKATGTQFMRTAPMYEGRYEIRTATLVDLIRLVHGFDNDKIVGGPSWIEMDRFDIIAKAPSDTSLDTLKEMTKTLLAERLQLITHTETRQLPVNALTLGRKHQLKEADGTGDTGCRMQNNNSGGPGMGGMQVTRIGGDGAGAAFTLGRDGMIRYSCRNMTMESFAAGLRAMLSSNVGPNPVPDHTGLAGKWNFDLQWSLGSMPAAVAGAAERIPFAEALEKQLGLKLEQVMAPIPVIVVDSANRAPSANPPGLAEALPLVPAPTAFDVATIRPTDPDYQGGMMSTRNGTLTARGMSLRNVVRQAFTSGAAPVVSEGIVGIPNFAESIRFDITARAPASAMQLDFASMAPMMRRMLEERFGMKWHTEQRPMQAYSLIAAKPKMKKADPASRTRCARGSVPPGSPPGTQLLTCQNITMAEFVTQLPNNGPGMNWPILDATNLEGGWDFTLVYVGSGGMNAAGPAGAGMSTAIQSRATLDPGSALDVGGGFTLFEALEKQLGLRLEAQKRAQPIIVIDRLEEKPTDN